MKNNPYTPSFIKDPPTSPGVARRETKDGEQEDTPLGYGLYF